MKTRFIQLTASLTLAGLSTVFTGCRCVQPDRNQEAQALVFDKRPKIASPPSGNFGTINVVPSTDLTSNTSTTGCFPSSSGWDKYYATGYFLGPGATANPNNFPNTNSTAVTITTVGGANGATLDTGILINYEYNPNDKVCNDDVGTNPNPKLSTATKTLDNNKRYRLTVFFKSSTIGSLTNIQVNWQYQ